MRRAQYISEYRDVGLAGAVADASPHQLVALLLHGARERIQTAIVAIGRNDVGRKVKAINGAYAILEGLRITLDRRSGGEIAAGLDELYRYGGQRLVEANAANDPQRLKEVDALLDEVESAWKQIPGALRGNSP
ncbi:MAG TPA: flagellar export chaperone FliS [Rudaea sp.]